MKKALCVLLAVTFICSVVVHGRNERFSTQKMIENITNFEDVPTIEDLVNVWQEDGYFDDEAFQYPHWEDIYVMLDGNLFHFGYKPLALDSNNRIPDGLVENIDYMYIAVYNSVGDPVLYDLPLLGGPAILPTNHLPVRMGLYHSYESYNGDNEVLEFFDNIKGFFVKVGSTISLAGEMFLSVFDNLQYLLPWKNTVPKGE